MIRHIIPEMVQCQREYEGKGAYPMYVICGIYAWVSFKELEQRPQNSTSYCEEYLFSPNNLGLNETIAYCREYTRALE